MMQGLAIKIIVDLEEKICANDKIERLLEEFWIFCAPFYSNHFATIHKLPHYFCTTRESSFSVYDKLPENYVLDFL